MATPDYIPWPKKLEMNWDAAVATWKRRPMLAVSALLVFFVWGAYNTGKVSALKDRIRELETKLQVEQFKYLQLESHVAPLLERAAREFPGTEISDSLQKLTQKLDSLDPKNQILATCSAFLEMKVRGNYQRIDYWSPGPSILLLGHNPMPLLSLEQQNYSLERLPGVGQDWTLYRAYFISVYGDALSKPITELTNTRTIWISGLFPFIADQLQSKYIREGKLALTFNGRLLHTLPLPEGSVSSIMLTNVSGFVESIGKPR